ncbi:MAG: Xaa-Pro peptidase family protein [Desulfobacterales bacterium]
MDPVERRTPREEIDRRIAALQRVLRDREIDTAVILQKADLFYFSGTIQQAVLVVPAEGRPLLFVNKSLERARAESPLEAVLPLGSTRELPPRLAEAGLPAPRRIGLELDVLPANLFFSYRGLFPQAELPDISTDIRLLRAVKSPWEMERIREAAALSDRVASRVPELLREGMTEVELAGRVEAEARRLGHPGIVRMRLWGSELFYGHLLSGPSGAVPSYLSSPTGGSGVDPAVAQSAGFRRIGRNEPILVDYVFVRSGYISDHARIFSLGPLDPELERAHRAMIDLQLRLREFARPGVASGEVYAFALRQAEAEGYGEHFMGFGPERIRFVGHGVGLELDEFPFLNAGQSLALAEDMVVALEPKLIFPGVGVVGVENTHRVTAEGLVPFGCYPDEITVV